MFPFMLGVHALKVKDVEILHGGGPGGGGGGATDSLSLGTNCETPFLDKGQPPFCYLQIYSPLFSLMLKDISLKSTLNDELSI